MEIARLKADGVTPTEIAARLGIGRASVYRVLAESLATPQLPDGRVMVIAHLGSATARLVDAEVAVIGLQDHG
jgi:hypothetical protein